MQRVEGDLADKIGEIGEERAGKQQFTDPLELDANYVRRPDAEISGRGRQQAMGAEQKHKEGAFAVREFRAEDAAAASEILREAREAASWSRQALLEFMPLPGAVALMSERAGRPTGFVLGRLVADEAEVLNLAVREECRRQGEGRALVEELLRRFADLA